MLFLDLDSESEEEDLAILYLLFGKRIKRRRTNYLRGRSTHGEFKLCQEISDSVFRKTFRLNKDQFTEIHELVKEDVTGGECNAQKAIRSEEKLAVCLRADNSEDREEFMASLVDNIGYENTSDVKGTLQRFYNYFMAVTSEYGVLMYRCSDNGRAGMDTRYIWIPANRKLSDSGLQQLMDADSRCNFKGQLHKLPEKLRKPKE